MSYDLNMFKIIKLMTTMVDNSSSIDLDYRPNRDMNFYCILVFKKVSPLQ